MFIGSCKVYMYAEWVHSLKEKRMIIKSIIQKARNKFNISIAEVEAQDIHQTIVIAFACITNEKKHAENTMQNVINFIECNTDAVINEIISEII